MPSRQDQLHSYQFMIQRVVAALVMRETDPSQSPFRRAMGATLASVLIAGIGLGGVAAWAAIRGYGAKTGRDQVAVLVEKETGATYVRLQGTLHPVANYASALLIAGNNSTVRVSRTTLAGETRGPLLGIPDAPDSLPEPKGLSNAAWVVCSTAQGTDAKAGTRSVLTIGRPVAGGQALGDRAVVARHPVDGSLHLIWRQRRYPMPDAQILRFIDTSTAVPVSVALLDNLEVAATIGRIRLDRHGQPSDAVRDRRVGEVIAVRQLGQPDKFGVVTSRGVAPITAFQAELLRNDPQYAAFVGRTEVTQLAPSELNGLPPAPPLTVPNDTAPPVTTPEVVDARTGGLCASAENGKGVTGVRVGVPVAAGRTETPGRTARGSVLADRVEVAGGAGALVEAQAAPGATGGALSLVTDRGVRHPLSDPVKGRDVLGYGKVRPVQMPSGLVDLVPAGPALDAEAAKQAVGS